MMIYKIIKLKGKFLTVGIDNKYIIWDLTQKVA